MAEFDFDVFLSHNGNDKPLVRELKRLLVEHGLSVWLDEDELQPGLNWQPLLEAGVRSSKSAAVLIGPDGLGPWEDEERQSALILAVDEGWPVIPVLLPNCPKRPPLPLFLRNRTWVDLSRGYTDAAIDRLVWGIEGKMPGRQSGILQTAPLTPAELWPENPTARATGNIDCYLELHAIYPQARCPTAMSERPCGAE